MTGERIVCRLCGDTFEENDGEIVEGHLREMLQTILIMIDLKISANHVICNTCREKLEANYNFKKKCIFTEDSITPFVSENVKLNLKEVHNQIIKWETTEDDKNVCRLCLKLADHDMTLSEDEKEQFQHFLPEINLSHTNFVILCSTCYDLLHKYFIFMTSCLQQLRNYSLDRTENKIDITEEEVDTKLENFQALIKKEKDKKEAILDEKLVLNEELDIKCDIEEENDESHLGEDSSKDRWYTDSSSNVLLQSNCAHPFQISCSYRKCTFTHGYKEDLVQQVRSDHPAIKIYKCNNCIYETKYKYCLIRHVQTLNRRGRYNYCDPSKIKMYKCENCTFETKWKETLDRHIIMIHSDPSKIKMYKCENCSYETKLKEYLARHVRNRHTDSSKIKMYKCENCTFATKWKESLDRHIIISHFDPSTHKMYKCENCTFGTKIKRNLIRHVRDVHSDPSKIKKYKCENCSYETKLKEYLARHVRNRHTDPSKIKMYKCENCAFVTKWKESLDRHIIMNHFDPFTHKMYKCENCTFETKWKECLVRHIRRNHSDPSKIEMYKCENCSYETKLKANLAQHVRNRHTDPSKI